MNTRSGSVLAIDHQGPQSKPVFVFGVLKELLVLMTCCDVLWFVVSFVIVVVSVAVRWNCCLLPGGTKSLELGGV